MDEFEKWLRESHASSWWPDIGIGELKNMRAAYDAGRDTALATVKELQLANSMRVEVARADAMLDDERRRQSEEIIRIGGERDAALTRASSLIDLVEELVPLIGSQYDVPDLRELADDLTLDVKDESNGVRA